MPTDYEYIVNKSLIFLVALTLFLDGQLDFFKFK